MKQRQRIAIEKITGESREWHPEAVKAFFAFTDRGEKTDLISKVWRDQAPDVEFNEVEQDLWDLMFAHKFHPVIVEMWKEDFKKGLLYLDEFIGVGYPDSYIKHAFEVYKGRNDDNYIPTRYAAEADRLGVERF